MSDDQPMEVPPPAPGRRGCAAVLLAVLGVFLLLPGLCVVITAVITLPDLLRRILSGPPADPYFWSILGGWAVFWLICLLISYLGIRLIRRASS